MWPIWNHKIEFFPREKFEIDRQITLTNMSKGHCGLILIHLLPCQTYCIFSLFFRLISKFFDFYIEKYLHVFPAICSNPSIF